MGDFDRAAKAINQMRKSRNFDRSKKNIMIKDVTEARLKKDILLVSETAGSVGRASQDPYNPHHTRGMRRTVDSKQ